MRDNNISPFRKLIDMITSEAISLKHEYVGTEHVLLGLLRSGGIESRALSSAGANYDLIRQVLLKNKPMGETSAKMPHMSDEFKQLIEDVNIDMRKNRDRVNFAVYMLKNLLWTDGMAMELLRATNVNPREINNLLETFMAASDKADDQSETPNLDKYGDDLTKKALTKIDGVIGREKEIERIIQVITRRTKNNPVLIGEAGVGKTAIVEGIAKKIAEGNVPDIMSHHLTV